MITPNPETKEEAIALVLDLLIPFDPNWAARDEAAALTIEENKNMLFQLHKIWVLTRDTDKTTDERLSAIKDCVDEWQKWISTGRDGR